MSNPNAARRASAQIFFQGVDISASILPYLLSVTYTDSEEDETDELQIKLQDRDGIWLERWLTDAVNAAASSAPVPSTSTTYKVTAKSGLNVRSGPGTNYGKYGALVYGAEVRVESIESGWAKISYNGKTAYVSASYIQASNDASTHVTAQSNTPSGFQIQAAFLCENWTGSGKDKALDCGIFELDDVNCSGPPAVIELKASALPFSSQIRQTEVSKAWEDYYLSKIAKEMAFGNGMSCMFLADEDPFYKRVEQYRQSDIAFLSKLCHDAGLSLKATSNMLVIFDQAKYEDAAPSLAITKGDGSYTKYKLNIGKADVRYASCRVSYTDPATGSCISGIAYAEDYKAGAKNNQQLNVYAAVHSVGEATALAKKALRLHNKYEKTATFTMPGDPGIVAGITATVKGFGAFDGKYIVKQAKHQIGSGYTTQVSLRNVLAAGGTNT